KRALAHDPVDSQRQLIVDLRERKLRDSAIATTHVSEQRVGVFDGAFAAFDCHVHSVLPHRDMDGAGQNQHPFAGNENKVDPARVELTVKSDPGGKIVGESFSSESSHRFDPRPSDVKGGAGEAVDL